MNCKPWIQTSEAAARRGAFTLIEMIAVLVVLALLALALTAVLVQHLDIAGVKSETAALVAINNALTTHILRSNAIPSEAVWTAAVANWATLPPASITANARNRTRAYLIDTNGWLGPNLPTTGYFVQSVGGTTITNSARLMIISSLSADLPLSSGRPSATAFSDIWNTPEKTIPSTWTGWNGRGDDLLIQRIDLQPLFSRLILVNRGVRSNALYVIAGQTNVLAGRSITNSYFINGSVLALGATNSGANTIQTSSVLVGNTGFIFEGGVWSGQIGIGAEAVVTNGLSDIALRFKIAEQAFLAAPDSPDNANFGGAAGDQQQVLAAMSDFMNVYALWSGASFTFHNMSQGQAKNHLSIYLDLQFSQTWLDQASGITRSTNGTPIYSGLLY